MRRFFLISLLTVFFLTNVLAQDNVNVQQTDSEQKNVNTSKTDGTDKTVKSELTAEDLKEDGSVESEQLYNLKLRTLEEKINSLKDKIFRSKQRLAILQETVLSGSIAGSRLTIVHKNEVGGAFRLISATVYLDEAPIFRKTNSPQELNEKEIVVFEGSTIPGPHHISVQYVYEGRGYGVFSYMKGYTIDIRAGHSFNIEEGNLVEIKTTPKDKGPASNIDNRLYASFEVIKKLYEEKDGNEEELKK